jgi:hypothetical protein
MPPIGMERMSVVDFPIGGSKTGGFFWGKRFGGARPKIALNGTSHNLISAHPALHFSE